MTFPTQTLEFWKRLSKLECCAFQVFNNINYIELRYSLFRRTLKAAAIVIIKSKGGRLYSSTVFKLNPRITS